MHYWITSTVSAIGQFQRAHNMYVLKHSAQNRAVLAMNTSVYSHYTESRTMRMTQILVLDLLHDTDTTYKLRK